MVPYSSRQVREFDILQGTEEEDHEHEGEAADHSEEAADHSEEGHDHGGFDPHVWLSPKQAQTEVKKHRSSTGTTRPNPC